jgi:hypothetical protein
VIFDDELTMRVLDLPDWYMLMHAKKRNLVMTRAVNQPVWVRESWELAVAHKLLNFAPKIS